MVNKGFHLLLAEVCRFNSYFVHDKFLSFLNYWATSKN